jgi:hypothetical protein
VVIRLPERSLINISIVLQLITGSRVQQRFIPISPVSAKTSKIWGLSLSLLSKTEGESPVKK